MRKIALCLKPTEFFKERVSNVLTKNKIKASETVEFYIVDLLERFIAAKEISSDPLAIQLLKSQELGVTGIEKVKILKNLGDTSLYVSGFFRDSLNRKIVDLDYYREMGAIAYKSLSESIREESFHDLYQELYIKFSGFVEVLAEISHDLLPQTDQNLLRLYEVYIKTGSESAKKHLLEQGFLTSGLKKN